MRTIVHKMFTIEHKFFFFAVHIGYFNIHFEGCALLTVVRNKKTPYLCATKKNNNMNIEQKLGLRITILRRQQMISQEELARKADITRSYMSLVENGKRSLSVHIAERVARTGSSPFEVV